MKKVELIVPQKNEGDRLDKYLSEELAETRSLIQKWIDQDSVLVNNQIQSKKYKVQCNDVVSVEIPDPVSCDVVPQTIPIDIVYEDDDLLVVNKPKGMVVHPAPGHRDNTLVNALLAHCGDSLSGIGGVSRPGIVHRIDKDTSGLLMVAKNDYSHQHLAKQIKDHSFTRIYETIVCGHLKEENGTINQPIGRHPKDRKKMAVTAQNSRDAVSHYKVLEQLQSYDYVQIKLETGRTHQIRVHMAYLGHPVLGDPVYGHEKSISGLNGQCLHAKTLGFIHPRTEEYMEFTSELPEYFKNQLNRLRNKA